MKLNCFISHALLIKMGATQRPKAHKQVVRTKINHISFSQTVDRQTTKDNSFSPKTVDFSQVFPVTISEAQNLSDNIPFCINPKNVKIQVKVCYILPQSIQERNVLVNTYIYFFEGGGNKVQNQRQCLTGFTQKDVFKVT